MGLVLDSSILIATERKKFDFSLFSDLEASAETFYVPAIVGSELLVGVHRTIGRRKESRSKWVETIIEKFSILSFDLPCARIHAKIKTDLKTAGTPIGPHDLEIAATALLHGFRLATLNEDEFERVPNLQLANARPFLI